MKVRSMNNLNLSLPHSFPFSFSSRFTPRKTSGGGTTTPKNFIFCPCY